VVTPPVNFGQQKTGFNILLAIIVNTFERIIYYAFIRRIQKEKKQVTIKHKMLLDSNFDDMALQPGEDREFHNQFTEFLKKNLPIEEVPKIESLAHHREMKKEKRLCMKISYIKLSRATAAAAAVTQYGYIYRKQERFRLTATDCRAKLTHTRLGYR
jgi:hypothetical protein